MTTVVSLFQPSGSLHLGNYVGALRPWARLAEDAHNTCYYGIATYHAMTVLPAAETLRIARAEAARWLTALIPRNAYLYDQPTIRSHVLELGWMLQCASHLGELERMPQFRSKAPDTLNAPQPMGLLTYPVLMVADIAVLGGEVIPVGHDQRHHLEFAERLVARFNRQYGAHIATPRALYDAAGCSVPALDGDGKMSKSQPTSCIFLTDNRDTLAAKIRGARTASDGGPCALLRILEALFPDDATTAAFATAATANACRYGDLKEYAVAAIGALLAELQGRYVSVSANDVGQRLYSDAMTVRDTADDVMYRVRNAMGL